MVGQLLTWDGYATAWAGLHGGFDPRGASVWVRGWLRTSYRISRLLARSGVRPLAVTVSGLFLSLGVPVIVRFGTGWLPLAAVLVLLSAVADTVDGALAVITTRTSRLGYVYDSVTDRLSEAAWLTGLWLLGTPGWLAVLCGGLAWLHEYVRARASSAGMSEVGVVTVAERPTRIIVVSVALVLGWLSGLLADDLVAGTVTIAVIGWVALGAFGLAQLLGAVRRALR